MQAPACDAPARGLAPVAALDVISDLGFPLFGAKAMGVPARIELPNNLPPGDAFDQGALYAEGEDPSRTGRDTTTDRGRTRLRRPYDQELP